MSKFRDGRVHISNSGVKGLIKIVSVLSIWRHEFKSNPSFDSGLGLDDMSLAWPAVVQLWVFIYSGIQ